jgi:serine-type D-Ala-D-Ala carboxypeptidase/endopeptidase (penicillin-binding protein 4)
MMQNRLSCGFLSLTLFATLSVKPSIAGMCPAQVAEKISAITSQPEFRRSRWGILVQTLGDRQMIYAQDADRYFIPASNAKLLTTAAALEVLGDRYTIRTSVEQISPGVLRIVGRGDPSLTDAQLNQLAKQIRDRNILQINQLIADDSYFQGDAVNPSWEWEDIQSGYGAPVNSLILNQNQLGLTLFPQSLDQPLRVAWDNPAEATGWEIDNTSQTVAVTEEESLQVGRDLGQPFGHLQSNARLQVRGQLRVGSAPEAVAIAIPQPARNFLQHFKQALAKQGIRVIQSSVSNTIRPPQGSEIAAVESAPLAQLIAEANQESNNLYAESLLRTMGTTKSPQSDLTLKAGIDVMEKALTQLGVDATTYDLVDGSGLSRHNGLTPETLVQTLQGMGRSPNFATYRNSLAVAGSSGTLRNRFVNSPVAGRLQGKTGFLTGSTALSGYLEPPDYSPLVLSILINQFDSPLGEVQEAIDKIVIFLAQLQRC